MQIAVRQVDGLFSAPRIRFAQIQLLSPFTGANPELKFLEKNVSLPAQFVWTKPEHILARKRKVATILGFIEKFKPHVLVFPEYTVPKECHDLLQRFADETKCIIVPGTYYEYDRGSSLFRSNLCTIYLPYSDPLTIIKEHGFRTEAQALASNITGPHMARLLCTTPHGKTFSLNVFLCRDYLIPYDEHHTSQMDWGHVGLNIVVMCSAQRQLFEGQAAFDVRRLRGSGKFVALCNTAGTAIEGSQGGGSALLGPTQEHRRRYGDVIEFLPTPDEGVITAELDLDDAALIETRPDKQVFDPLVACSRFHFLWSEDARRVQLQPIEGPRVVERGVWHPAFLQVVERNIALFLLITRRYRKARDLFRTGKMSHVSAVSLAGVHDILIRCYESTLSGDDFPGMPYCILSRDQINEFFPDRRVKFLVLPNRIYKYRTVPINDPPEEWERRRKEIQSLLPKRAGSDKRKNILHAVSRLARDWSADDVHEHIRNALAPVFCDQHEITTHVGPGAGNSLRQRYLLVSISDEDELQYQLFEAEVIRRWLNKCDQVRSVYGLTQVHGQTPFHFWIDIIADPYVADRVISELEDRCEQLGIEVGIRSIEAMEYLMSQSVEAIEGTDFGQEVRSFWTEIGDLDPVAKAAIDIDRRVRDNHTLVIKCGCAWYAQAGQAADAVVRKSANEFYCYLFCGNFAQRDQQADEYLRVAGTAWERIYQVLEQKSCGLLFSRFGVDNLHDLRKGIREYFRNAASDAVQELVSNPVRALFDYLKSEGIELADVDMKAVRRQLSDSVFGFRNDLVHGRAVEALSFRSDVSETKDITIDRIIGVTNALFLILTVVDAYLEELGS